MVLFNVRLISELPLAADTARRFAARGERVGFCCESNTPDAVAAVTAAAGRLSAPYFNMADATADATRRQEASTVRALKKLAARAAARVVRSGPFRPPSPLEQRIIDELSAQCAGARAVLHQSRADVVVVAQDGAAGNAALIATARQEGIPVVCCPYGFGTSRDFDDYLDERHAEGSLNFVTGETGERIRREYPQWIRRSAYGEVLMYAPEYIAARERLDMSLPLPWVIHGGAADLLAAESEAMYHHYLREGIASAKVKLTGSVYCDAMHDTLAAAPDAMAARAERRKLRAGATSVLVSLPPSLHGVRARSSEFDSYEAGCAAIVKLFNTSGVAAVVSLHPNAPPEQRRFVESLGLAVSTEWIVSLIPRFDLFFTTFSSTIRWAIACGKPVLNYNMYSYNNHDYDDVAGVFTSARLGEIAATLHRLTDDREYADVAARQHEDGARWGLIDGRNFERIHAAVAALRDGHVAEAAR
jgi:hypothetical protein